MKKIGLLLVLVVGLVLITGCVDTDIHDSDAQLTLAQFNEIQEGMTKQEVWDIIGDECTQTSSSVIPGIEGISEETRLTMYGCNGYGQVGANAILSFTNDELTSKSQIGLR